MENDVLGHKSPLFGKRTAQFKIEGFDYYDAAKMLNSVSDEDKVKYYACVGGTPHYLAQVDTSISFEENIKDLFFQSQGYLYGEPLMLLQQELREPAMYNSIISAIATGSSRLNEISTKIGEETSKTIKYIKTLTDLMILRKANPFGDNPERSKKSIYMISDNCYRFWYKYIFLHKTGIETRAGEEIAESLVFPGLSAFIGKIIFEDICRQYLIRQNKKRTLPFLCSDFGIWWGTDRKEKTTADFDVVADNKIEKKILMCECKWKNEQTDAGEIKKLMSKTYLLPGYPDYNQMAGLDDKDEATYYNTFIEEGSEINVRVTIKDSEKDTVPFDDMQKGKRYFLRSSLNSVYSSYKIRLNTQIDVTPSKKSRIKKLSMLYCLYFRKK